MRVLMLNTFEELGGAARAAGRLHQGLRGLGVESRLLVHFPTWQSSDAVCPGNFWVKGARRLKLFLGTLPVRRYPKRPVNNFTPALLPDRLPARVAREAPDLVHLHWLGAGFCGIESLGRFSRPLVWTLHDSWAFTGGCHLPGGCERYRERCGNCPVLGSRRDEDLSRRTWRRKENAWRHLNLTLVSPSRWLADCARSSSLLGRFRVEVIPNGLDPQRFRPIEQAAARALLGLPRDSKLVLFGAVNATTDPNKGWHLLQPALKLLAGKAPGVEAAVFGASAPPHRPDVGMPVRFLGHLGDDALVAAYSAADVVVMPSLSEVLPLVAVEALATGTPVVAFGATGLPEVVDHLQDGYLATPYEVEDLARGIAWVLEEPGRRAELGRRARRKAAERFGLEATAGRYVALYRELLASTTNGKAK